MISGLVSKVKSLKQKCPWVYTVAWGHHNLTAELLILKIPSLFLAISHKL
jgi:hypothetical protein